MYTPGALYRDLFSVQHSIAKVARIEGVSFRGVEFHPNLIFCLDSQCKGC